MPAVNRPVDKGFVPNRRVATLGDAKSGDDADYRIVGRLGSGGTGVVYQAHQRAIDREVAIKVLRDELATNELSRERFLTEARVIGGLDHPNVIALHEVCVDDIGELVLFDEADRRDQLGSADWRDVAWLKTSTSCCVWPTRSVRPFAWTDSSRHQAGKCDAGQVRRSAAGRLGSCDQPRQRRIDAGDSIIRSVARPLTWHPNWPTGLHSSIGYQTDVYLLGAILFQILTGLSAASWQEPAGVHPRRGSQRDSRVGLDGELMDIAMKAMATDPADRYESVNAFTDAIKNQQQHEESERLVRRACERLAQASDANQYEDFRVADALLMEAIDVWPENARAHQTRKKLRLRFAEAATARGDLDLALSIYEAAGEADSDAAEAGPRGARSSRRSHERVSRYSALFTQSPEAGLLIQMSTGIVVEANEMFGCCSVTPRTMLSEGQLRS